MTCRYKGCFIPEDEHYCEAVKFVPDHKCFGGPTHDHGIKRSQGGKFIDFIWCAGWHDSLDNGFGVDGMRYQKRIKERPDGWFGYIYELNYPNAVVYEKPLPWRGLGEGKVETDVAQAPTPSSLTPSLITPTGLSPLPDNTTFEEWRDIGVTLGSIKTAVQWAIADWIRFGESHYGERYSQALDVTGLAYQTLLNYVSVANAYDHLPRPSRFGVAQALAPLVRRDPSEARETIARAEAEEWTSETAREYVRGDVEEAPRCPACGSKVRR